MKIVPIGLLGLVLILLLTGMGDLGGMPEGKVPETSRDVRVRLTDRTDKSVELSRFSMDGQLQFSAHQGKGIVAIPFEEIRSLTFGRPGADGVPVTVDMRGGQSPELRMTREATFYGRTGYGAYRIRSGDVRRIDFLEGD